MTKTLLGIATLALSACVVTGAVRDRNYILLRRIPYGENMTINIPILLSAGQCSVECNRQGSQCQGFVFQSTESTSQHSSMGTCQLVTFSDFASVTFTETASVSKGFYVVDPCWNSNNPCWNAEICSSNNWPRICVCPPQSNRTSCGGSITGRVDGTAY